MNSMGVRSGKRLPTVAAVLLLVATLFVGDALAVANHNAVRRPTHTERLTSQAKRQSTISYKAFCLRKFTATILRSSENNFRQAARDAKEVAQLKSTHRTSDRRRQFIVFTSGIYHKYPEEPFPSSFAG